MAITFRQLKKKFAGLFGDESLDANTANAEVNRFAQKVVHYEWEMPWPATASHSLPLAHAGSQPMRERVIYRAHNREVVKGVYLCQGLSSTLTATETMAWHLLVLKRGGSYGSGTATNTYSLTQFVAGLSSGTDKAGTHSNSWSALTSNTARYPNPCHLGNSGNGFGRTDTGAGKVQLGAGDILTAQILKGSGSADDSGAVFRGGQIIVVLEDN